MKKINEEKAEFAPRKNIRHIFFGILFFGLVFFLLGIFIKESRLQKVKTHTGTLGVSTSNKQVSLPDKKDAENILKGVQKEIGQITPDNIAASDSAILKIIQDLEKLRKGDATAIETVCRMICR